ncbi:lysine N(6)-hydroxylase/L-ornithine N(5)-oxygenase family protein [Azospirillum sp. TSO35-2]|uniref:lysine N(6)-hydroxylase/L-ornithine N(5)-oxygenase family protein n=1 Tax=Azospirillum sp. TSO35-2 TaxID=716796 RepID=UPI000D60BA86|nr:lysine N(6)-hydroxylase/L-ornithine N(5)-oxygenase family protein [Azospirillum sp. TSO35-2]PWC35919.1 ornithine monooxygenase [Azospirillum sp. TSO35-2]
MHGIPALIGGGNTGDGACALVGVGFGPSNLALAVALREAGVDLGCRFLEKRDRFVWHGNMLLHGSRMQISFLKDLVSLRDPTSRYSFLNYLHGQGRLQDFINLRTFYPSRREFNDYLAWVAADFDDQCEYGLEATAVEPERTGEGVSRLRVHARDRMGRERSWLTRNVVIGAGATPKVPEPFLELVGKAASGGPLVVHSNDYLAAADALARAGRVAVIGLGQSAAEIFLDLHGRGVAVDVIARGPAMRPADSSPFANQVFDAGYTDYLYGLPPGEREALLRAFHNTNYAVVDPELIDAIYGILYQQKVERSDRHRMLTRHDILAARADARADSVAGVVLDLAGLDHGGRDSRRYGAVVLATGYRRHIHRDLLRPMEPWLTDGEVGRDYRLPTVPGCTAGIYLQGCCEATHGLSDTLLSILPIRAQEIAQGIAAGLTGGRGMDIRTLMKGDHRNEDHRAARAP